MKVVMNELGAFVHDEIRWSSCVVVVDDKFVVVQGSSRDDFRKDLSPGQSLRRKTREQPRALTESYPEGGLVRVGLS